MKVLNYTLLFSYYQLKTINPSTCLLIHPSTQKTYENTFVMQINKWMSAQLFVYPRFDDGVGRDGHHGYWQFKEFASIGFSYVF